MSGTVHRGRLAPVIASISGLALTATLAGCGGASQAETATDETPSVMIGVENLFVAEQRVLQTGPAISGTLQPEREATVRAELGGRLVRVTVENGQPVRRGQLLGQITDDALRDQLQSARSGVRTATEAAEVARRNAERAERLAKGGAIAERELEQARWNATSADGQVEDAKARLASMEQQWGHTQLHSPIDGVVAERRVNTGDVVTSGTALFTVVDPSSLRLEALVPVSALGSLKVGTPVPFLVDGYGDRRFDGRIERINPAVDPNTRQVRITVALPNKAGALVSGLFAQGRVAIESREGVVVPTSAIDRRGLRPQVTRVRAGVAERVEVTTGIEDPGLELVELTAGIAVGDTVVIGAARTVQAGARVSVAATAERAAGSN
ncbi:MAG: efflux RND transporter periplasmic adaptor subunit [Gemmatimonadales bacterium]